MDFIKIIDDAIANLPEEERRPYIGASGIGNPCGRKIWNDYKGIQGKPITPRTKRIFLTGHILENMVMDYIESAGFKVVRPEPGSKGIPVHDPDFPLFCGHMDGLLYLTDTQVVVLEIKSANNAEFKKFVENGLKSWKVTYFSQVMSYMGMEKIKRALVVVLNKDTSDWACEWVDYDDIMYTELKVRAIGIAESVEPPDKINSNATWWQCQMCRYKEVCHKPGETNVSL